MRKNLILFFIVFIIHAFAQNPQLDSLLLALQHNQDQNQKTILLNKISEQYKTSDPDSMKKYANQALQLAQKQKNTKEQAIALQNLGTSEFLVGEYNVALRYFDQSEKLLKNLNENENEILLQLIKVNANRGILFAEQNQYAKALENDFRALQFIKKLKDEKRESIIYNNIGVIYRSIDDDQHALQYFLKAYEIQKKAPEYGFGDICANIGLIYLNKKELDTAKKYFDEALIFFNKNPHSRGLGELYNNLAHYHGLKNDPKLAKDFLYKAEKIFTESDDHFGLSDTYLFLAQIFLKENDLDQATSYIQKSKTIADELDLTEAKMNVEKVLSEIYEKKGEPSQALLHEKKYNEYVQKLSVIENTKERIRTELNYQNEKENLEQKEKSNREKLYLVIGFLALAFATGIAFLIYKNRKSKENILLQKQLAEYQHKALHLQMNPHFVFNCLAAISSFVLQNGKEDAIKYLSKFSKLMRLTLDFSKESEIAIDKEIEALKNYLELEQLRFPNKFDFRITKSPEIEDDTAIPSLLLQPYVENAVIHGVVPENKKGLIQIDFSQKEHFLYCKIEDDGVGIETSQKKKENFVNPHQSMALEISKKRLEIMEKIENKQVRITIEELKSETGNSLGTRVVLKLPLGYLKN